MLNYSTPAGPSTTRKSIGRGETQTGFIGPRRPTPNADSTSWWSKNKVPRSLVEQPSARKECAEFLGAFGKQESGAIHHDVKQVALKLYDGINTPLSLKLKAALLSGDAQAIATCKVDPRNYQDAQSYFLDACAGNFLRKFEDLNQLCPHNTVDTEAAAVAEFFRAEAVCKETNERLELYANGQLRPCNETIDLVIEKSRALIAKVLGDVPAHLDMRFGPGATSCCTGDSVTIADKLCAKPTLTLDSLPHIAVMKSSRVWLNLIRTAHPEMVYNLQLVTDDYGDEIFLGCDIAPLLVPGNRFTSVPKDATTNRGICIEPHTLSALQLAVGSLLTGKLERVGLVKQCQQDVNRMFALLGSYFDSYATVDMKAASDTIAYELVKLLLPGDWYEFLASLRSPSTWIDERWVDLEKFSSMGNGFTFELETLIFYALARTVSDIVEGDSVTPVCTFGDDVIITSSAYALLTEVLDFCGFTVNRTKSFMSGPFRESCGGDYFLGFEVRPYFLKEAPTNASDWFGVCNGIGRMRDQLTLLGLPDNLGGAWLRCLNHVPRSCRLFGPKDQGDDWIGTNDRRLWRTTERGGIPYILGRNVKARYRRLERYCSDTQYAAILYGGVSHRIPLRGDPAEVAVAWYALNG